MNVLNHHSARLLFTDYSGNSSLCPKQAFKSNGELCNSGTGKCYDGVFKYITDMCRI